MAQVKSPATFTGSDLGIWPEPSSKSLGNVSKGYDQLTQLIMRKSSRILENFEFPEFHVNTKFNLYRAAWKFVCRDRRPILFQPKKDEALRSLY